MLIDSSWTVFFFRFEEILSKRSSHIAFIRMGHKNRMTMSAWPWPLTFGHHWGIKKLCPKVALQCNITQTCPDLTSQMYTDALYLMNTSLTVQSCKIRSRFAFRFVWSLSELFCIMYCWVDSNSLNYNNALFNYFYLHLTALKKEEPLNHYLKRCQFQTMWYSWICFHLP